MEAEMMRKKEHLTSGTNFEQARGWTRSSFKTKGMNPDVETMEDFLHFSSSEEEDNK